MSTNPVNDGEIDLTPFRTNMLIHIRTAFQIIPPIKNPSILDIGCGSGVPTIELAKISSGHITAIDIDQKLLDVLQTASKRTGFSNKITIRNMSIHSIDFAYGTFDIVWSEGSIYVVGFEMGLKNWRPLLKEHGYLVVHDDMKNSERKRKLVAECGYDLLGQLFIEHEIWWKDYYEPLQRCTKRIRTKSVQLKEIEKEIDAFKRNPRGSVYFIMQKI